MGQEQIWRAVAPSAPLVPPPMLMVRALPPPPPLPPQKKKIHSYIYPRLHWGSNPHSLAFTSSVNAHQCQSDPYWWIEIWFVCNWKWIESRLELQCEQGNLMIITYMYASSRYALADNAYIPLHTRPQSRPVYHNRRRVRCWQDRSIYNPRAGRSSSVWPRREGGVCQETTATCSGR